jgi:hypothetical protein
LDLGAIEQQATSNWLWQKKWLWLWQKKMALEALDGKRGAARKKSTDPPVHLLNLRPTHPPSDFFSPWLFFWYVFGRFSARGVQKRHKNILAKSPCRKSKAFFQNIDKNFDVSFSSTFFVLSLFRVFFSDGSSKTLQKNVLRKKSCRKVFTKNSTKSPKPTFSRFF